MTLEAHDLVLSHSGRVAVDHVDLEAASGKLLSIIGPNGSGKSTLLRGLARLHKPDSGHVTLDGRDVRSLSSRELARHLAILPQAPDGGFDLTVRELAWRGRYPHQGMFLRAKHEDLAAVRSALESCDLQDVAERQLGQLSGGERRRAWLALALAQQPRMLLLDEPTSFLDFEHQLGLMEIIDRLCDEGIGVIAVLHDVALAARFSDTVVALSDGKIAFSGSPCDVLTEAALEPVFRVRMAVVEDPASGAPLPVPLGRTRTPGTVDDFAERRWSGAGRQRP
ncbi:MAG TPA: ABC transporter ATP-binding protein [Dehalococcoidia bacterium]|nr:ABC transporter ATP-binding protein [Dehalococcoidia bacterium]